MINLIPNQDKKKMTRDFYLRFSALAAAALGVTLLVGCVLMLPSYFLARVKENLAVSKLAEQQSEPVPALDQQTLAEIQDLNGKLTLVETAEKNKYSVSQNVVSEVLSKKPSDIKITQISYNDDAVAGKTISIEGVAPSRDELLAFRQAIQDDANFSKVDLPISNFLKGTDIPFNLAITVK